MKRIRISAIITVVVLLLTSTSFVAHAAIEASEYLQYYNAYFTKTGNTIKTHFQVQGTETMDKVGVTEIYLYERANRYDNWSLVMTYLSTDSNYTTTMMGTNTGFKVDKVTYNGTSSYEYKAYITVYAEKDGGSDSRSFIIYS